MNGTSKLTPSQKEEAREMMARGVKRKHIAARFGVSPQAISRACAGVKSPIEHRGAHLRKKTSRFANRPWEDDL